MNPITVFFATAFVSSLIIRLFADYLKLRFYVQKRKGKYTPKFLLLKGTTRIRGVHIHHFVWGILIFVLAFAMLYEHIQPYDMALAGFAVALIASESKELVLQEWGP